MDAFTKFSQTKATSSSLRVVLYLINLILIHSSFILFVLTLNIIAFLVLINCSEVSLKLTNSHFVPLFHLNLDKVSASPPVVVVGDRTPRQAGVVETLVSVNHDVQCCVLYPRGSSTH